MLLSSCRKTQTYAWQMLMDLFLEESISFSLVPGKSGRLVITHKWPRLRELALLDVCGPEILSEAKDDSSGGVILSEAKDLSRTYG